MAKYVVDFKRSQPLTLGGVLFTKGEQVLSEKEFKKAAAVTVGTKLGERCYLEGLVEAGVLTVEKVEAPKKAKAEE